MKQSNRLLVACMPKSGSTYLTAILSNLPGFTVTSWVPAYGRREQELCSRRLQEDTDNFPNISLVAQHHVRYSDSTRSYIKEFDLKPIVLVRNLYDIIPSLIDHHRTESVVYPMAFVPPDIVNWNFEQAAKFITHMVLPWYFNFFVSWEDCTEKILVTYESLNTDPVKTIQSISVKWGIAASRNDIIAAIERVKLMQTRKNIGVTGRGEKLSDSCRAHINGMASYYNEVNFSKIGIMPMKTDLIS